MKKSERKLREIIENGAENDEKMDAEVETGVRIGGWIQNGTNEDRRMRK